MAITTKWLEEQGLTTEQVKEVFAERGKEIESEKSAKSDLESKLNAANADIEKYKTSIAELEKKSGDTEAMKTELQSLKQQIAESETAAAKEAEIAKLVERFKTANGDKKFVNELTENGVRNSFLAALADEQYKGKSDTEIIAAITLDKDYYQSQNPAANIGVPGSVGTSAAGDTLRRAMGLPITTKKE